MWQLPVGLALDAVLNGAVFALWPVMWIVFNALLLYNIAVRSGRFDAFRALGAGAPAERPARGAGGHRLLLRRLLEGIAGFGTPVAITSSLLILIGFPPLEALVFVLIFNTAPVAFGALGAPVTVLGAVTGLPAATLGAMVGRQLPLMALILPFYVIALYGGLRSVRALWPVLLVAGASFGDLPVRGLELHRLHADRRAGLAGLVDRHASCSCASGARRRIRNSRSRQPVRGSEPRRRRCRAGRAGCRGSSSRSSSSLDFVQDRRSSASRPSTGRDCTTRSPSRSTTTSRTPRSGPSSRWRPARRYCSRRCSRRSSCGVEPAAFFGCVAHTFRQIWLAIVTVMLIVGLAYLMNYSGLAYTLGKAVASAGHLFVLLSPFLGWVAVFLSGSDTSGNALFGNLQVVAARSSSTSIRCCSRPPIPRAASWAR